MLFRSLWGSDAKLLISQPNQPSVALDPARITFTDRAAWLLALLDALSNLAAPDMSFRTLPPDRLFTYSQNILRLEQVIPQRMPLFRNLRGYRGKIIESG